MTMSKKSHTDQRLNKSAFSCEPCRKRKVKCGGEQPKCKRCVAREDECLYKLNPTLSYTQRLEAKVRELKLLLLQASGGHANPDKMIDATHEAISPKKEESVVSLEGIERLTMSINGQVSLQGPTSMFNLPIQSTHHVGNCDIVMRLAENERAEQRQRHLANAWQQRTLEGFAHAPEPFHYLLDFHWSWIHPFFNFVHRPSFSRDMETLGPYYSHTLLSAILSHSSRWCHIDSGIARALEPYENGQLFARQASKLLHDDLRDGRCDIPTVQALLLISAQECSKGDWTQAWVYSGIAFRLVEDLGVDADGGKYAGDGGPVRFSDEEVEIRNRLFWSCYLWDKMISLYLGRCPAMQHSNVAPPRVMLDDPTEHDRWVPHGMSFPEHQPYPESPAYAVSTFAYACKLAEILNQLLIEVYDSKHASRAHVHENVRVQKQALQQWWAQLPPHLRLEPGNLPLYSPPSHIVTLNCLYHTTNILLHRPMLLKNQAKPLGPAVDYFESCAKSASAIRVIFELFCRTFGDGHCVMALSYSLYMAASVFLLQVQTTNTIETAVLEELQFCVRALQRVSTVNAVLKQGLHLLQSELQALGIDIDADLGAQKDAGPVKPPTYPEPPQYSMASYGAMPAMLTPSSGPAYDSYGHFTGFAFEDPFVSAAELQTPGWIPPPTAYSRPEVGEPALAAAGTYLQ